MGRTSLTTCSDAPAAKAAAQPTAHADLFRHDGGAIMVIGVFMAILLVGLLWYIAGIGTTIFHRERMQDAADAVALATAIGHARGMNLIVFINLVMAALVAIVLALKVIEMLLTGLILILAAIAWFFPPAGAAIPVVNSARSVVAEVHEAARQIVDAVLIVLHVSEVAIRVVTPAQSVITGMATITQNYGDVLGTAVAIPPRLTLPVEDDVYDRLCVEAEKVLKGLIEDAVGDVPLIGKVLSFALDPLISAVSRFYCYKDPSAGPPTHDIKIDRTLPQSPEGEQCEKDRAKMETNSPACQAWDQQLQQRRPNAAGNCEGEHKELCENNLAQARIRCDHTTNRGVENFSWAEATVVEEVKYNPESTEWETTSFTYEEPLDEGKLVNVDTSSGAADLIGRTDPENPEDLIGIDPKPVGGKPCNQGFIDYSGRGMSVEEQLARTWSSWNRVVEQLNEPPHVLPVCSMRAQALQGLPPIPSVLNGEDPHRPPPSFDQGPHTLRYQAIKHVYGCSEKATITMEMPGDWDPQTGASDGSDKSPQKMIPDIELGTGDFQMRGIAIAGGDGRPTRPENKLNVSAFHREVDTEEWIPFARGAGRINIAQAEYYYNHKGGDDRERDQWMWNMKWRARLVRFRMPGGDEESGQNAEASSSSNPDLSSFNVAAPNMDLSAVDLPSDAPSLDVLSDLIVH